LIYEKTRGRKSRETVSLRDTNIFHCLNLRDEVITRLRRGYFVRIHITFGKYTLEYFWGIFPLYGLNIGMELLVLLLNSHSPGTFMEIQYEALFT
jgi:hypothetical protein